MYTTKSNPFMTPALIEAVPTNVDSATLSSRSESPEVDDRDAWQSLIDYKLIEWGRNPEQFDDEGVEPPSRDTLQLAIALAGSLRDAEMISPDSVSTDANGGIVFERREKDMSEVFYVWDDGDIEYQRFHGTCLIKRRPL